MDNHAITGSNEFFVERDALLSVSGSRLAARDRPVIRRGPPWRILLTTMPMHRRRKDDREDTFRDGTLRIFGYCKGSESVPEKRRERRKAKINKIVTHTIGGLRKSRRVRDVKNSLLVGVEYYGQSSQQSAEQLGTK